MNKKRCLKCTWLGVGFVCVCVRESVFFYTCGVLLGEDEHAAVPDGGPGGLVAVREGAAGQVDRHRGGEAERLRRRRQQRRRAQVLAAPAEVVVERARPLAAGLGGHAHMTQ